MILQKRPWWDVAVVAALVVCAFLVWLDLAQYGSVVRAIVGGVGLVAFALAYAVFGRWMIGSGHPAAAQVYLAVMTLTVGVGTAASPNLAVLQVVAYPLIGCLAFGRIAGMIAWDIALAAVVFVGLALSPAGVASAAVTAVLSLLFAIAIGLWITRILNWGEERSRLLADLQAAQDAAAAAAREAGAARERERLSRDMHDTVAQSLTGLVMLVERAERQCGDVHRRGELLQTLQIAEDAARETLREIRALVAETASPPLDDGLPDAAQRVAARFARETGIVTTARFDAVRLPREHEVVLLRCLQEGLGNVRKHAGATHVTASLTTARDAVTLIVVDDGRGVSTAVPDTGAVAVAGRTTGFGLEGMRERLRSLGGEVELGAAENGGARLRVVLPAAGGAS